MCLGKPGSKLLSEGVKERLKGWQGLEMSWESDQKVSDSEPSDVSDDNNEDTD